MEKFEMTCQRVFVIVLILVAVPILCTGLMFSIILKIKDPPDWAVVSIITTAIVLMVFVVFRAMKKWVEIPCEVYLSPEKIAIKISRPGFIFGQSEYISVWDNLDAVSSNYEPQKEQRFYKVQFKDPVISIYLSPAEKVLPGEETKFGTLLMNYVANHNSNAAVSTPQKISTRNFYQGRWAKIFTYIVLIIILGTFILYLAMPDKVDGWRIFQLTAFASVWFSAYYINRKRKSR